MSVLEGDMFDRDSTLLADVGCGERGRLLLGMGRTGQGNSLLKQGDEDDNKEENGDKEKEGGDNRLW
jgi:hypothetical protein